MLEQKKRLLLYRLRKEMNGAALDTMRYFGADYGRNYGVQIYAIRNLAREIGTDHDLAKSFYTENIREVRLVALWIADAEQVSVADFDFWASGIINSEVAEQAAMALLSRIERIDDLIESWSQSDNILLGYAAMLAAARNAERDDEIALGALYNIIESFPDNRLAGQGAVVLLSAIAERNAEAVIRFAETLPQNSTAQFIREEIEWRVAID